MPRVTIIDYGIGNILSVSRAFEQCGATVVLTAEPKMIEDSEYLVLPGVGAFSVGMAGLRERGLIDPIKKYAANDRPFLGICLGMQMMFDESEEFGSTEGLGLIPGKILAIPRTRTDGSSHKIPHIGWNEICPPEGISWDRSILSSTNINTAFYFVHSFTGVPTLNKHRLADSYYGQQRIAATVKNGNSYGCQFHPEKSGSAGLTILRTFLEL